MACQKGQGTYTVSNSEMLLQTIKYHVRDLLMIFCSKYSFWQQFIFTHSEKHQVFLTPDISQAPFPTYESEKRGNGYLFFTENKVNHSPAQALPLLTYLTYSMENVVLTMLSFPPGIQISKGFCCCPNSITEQWYCIR